MRLSSLSFSLLFLNERQPKQLKQTLGFLVRLGCRHKSHIHTLRLLHLIKLHFRKDNLLLNTQRIVAAAVKAAIAITAEVANTRHCNREKAVQELIHTRPAQRDLRTDGLSLTKFEA